MMTCRRHQAAALALALLVTLVTFSGVSALAGADHGAALLARVGAPAQG